MSSTAAARKSPVIDPRQEAVLPGVDFGTRVIVMCREGYTSSLAADALRSPGLSRATDLVGGFAAWRGHGLPVARPAILRQG